MSDERTSTDRDELVEVPSRLLRVAPLGEIKVYQITEEELDQLAEGSPASLWLNFGLSLASVFVTSLVSILSTTTSDRTYIFFVVVCVVSGLLSAVLLFAWLQSHRRQGKLADRIRLRMPPQPVAAEGDFTVEENT